jgi:protein O-mannose beta-1,4-N-acetylglucosaminyltransferase
MSRKENRKILNEVELAMNIIKSTGLKVVMLNYESYSLAELISYVSHSKGVIAMHGSLLILGMFLKTGSFVIELYPYAVNPSNYTPYKTLSELPGMGLIYRPWVNTIKANSVGHPDWPPESGGVNHLEEDQQSVILAQTEVPQHLCCSDPSWLYHIYQDTIVETEEISSLVKSALSDKRAASSNNTELIFHPSRVQNLSCAMKSSNLVKSETIKDSKPFLWLKWDTPWTASYFDTQTIHYEILLQKYGDLSNPVMSFQSLETGLVIDVEEFMYYNVWVRCMINTNIPGPYTNVLCQR